MKQFCSALLAAFWLSACASTHPAASASQAAATNSKPPAAFDNVLRTALWQDLHQYLVTRSVPEHISAIVMSVSLHGEPQNITIGVGNWKLGPHAVTIANDSLWQIGSNTKAFTAAAILQLEAEGKLTIDQTVGRWLPQYPAWKNVTIRRLLNMTSGIPGYDNAPAMLTDYAKNPQRNFTIPQLIAYVYPSNPRAPKPTKGYDYSNTNYLLAELIVERAGGAKYGDQLQRRFFQPLALSTTFYTATQYPPGIRVHMPAGYYFNHDPDSAGLAPLLGHDVRAYSVSWMQGAGGIVSTPEELTRWARALYAGSVLAPKQRAELTSIVSLKTGKPIATTSAQDPRGFGLGVAQMTTPETGTVWFYEGMTLGYRMVHVYFPKQDAVIAFGLNSQPDSKQNQSGKLAIAIYKTLHDAGRL